MEVRGGGYGSSGVFFFLIISKNLPLKGKFFEMVSRALPPRGVWGAWPPQESPLITRALPPQRPCLAPVPCPQFFFVSVGGRRPTVGRLADELVQRG